MDLISKTKVIELLNKRRDYYRADTDVGKNLREGIEKAIHDVEDAYPRELYTLENLGESDLSDLKQEIEGKLNKLVEEPEIELFLIKGFYDNRYTKCHIKAKEILREEFELMIENIEEDYADSKMDIQMKNIKESNLKDYKIEG
jgi:hypothetical protein